MGSKEQYVKNADWFSQVNLLIEINKFPMKNQHHQIQKGKWQ